MNIYSLQLLIIFICYLNALVFTSILCFSCFICLDEVLSWFAIVWFIHSSNGLLALMPISIMQWVVEMGSFNIRFSMRCKSNALGPLTPLIYTITTISITFLSIFLLLCGDVELNPWSTKKLNSWFNFSICHRNLNSLTVQNFEKVILLEPHNTVNKFDIIYLSKSFLDSSILTENNNLNMNGYKMMRVEHPNNVKRGSVCAYVRESLPDRNFSNSYLSERLTLEVIISNNKGYVVALYRSPNQTSDEFQSFINNLEKLLINIVLIVVSWYYLVTLMLNQNRGQSMTQQQKKVKYWKT